MCKQYDVVFCLQEQPGEETGADSVRPVQRQEVHLLQKRRLEVSTRTEEWWCRMSTGIAPNLYE